MKRAFSGARGTARQATTHPHAPDHTKPRGETAQFNIALAAKASPRTRSAAPSSTAETTSA